MTNKFTKQLVNKSSNNKQQDKEVTHHHSSLSHRRSSLVLPCYRRCFELFYHHNLALKHATEELNGEKCALTHTPNAVIVL